MKKGTQLYEGKAKKVYLTDDPDVLIVDYKDDATAFNGEKKGTIVGKGAINNRMSNYLFKQLEKEGIPTHLIEELSDRETAVKKVSIVPLEVIVRNVAAGSFSKRLGVPEGTEFTEPTIEFSYKNDELGDPLINDYFARALNLASWAEIETIKKRIADIEDIQNRGGFAHFRNQLANIGTGALRPKQMHGKALAAFAAGDDGQQNYQHTHTAQPMAEGAPVQDALA